ncbi:tumor necrosis factor receptor superfamily member 6 isoform 1-T1 [Pholidichthys leucotaenia]
MAAFFKFSVWFVVFILFFSDMVDSSVSSQSRAEGHQSLRKGKSRSRRQTCADGTYVSDVSGGKNCCLCAAGQRVEKHCTNKDDGTCVHCESGKTYNNEPNSRETCKVCTSCDQPNANLEVETECTLGKDAKCRCKEGFFCTTEPCKICQPCKKCASVKVACNRTSDTVCNDNSDKSQTVAIVVPIVVIIAIVAFAVGGVFLWRNKQKMRKRDPSKEQGSEMEITPLTVSASEIGPFLPDIAKEIGWKIMKDVARRTDVHNSDIESAERDNPNDCHEQTLQLLKIFVEKHGKEAPNVLLQTLKSSGRNGTAQKIHKLLSQDK